MTEEDPQNSIILYIESSIDIFRKPQLVTDIERRNQVLHTYNYLVSKIKRNQAMVLD